jgi:hypothetical protein
MLKGNLVRNGIFAGALALACLGAAGIARANTITLSVSGILSPSGSSCSSSGCTLGGTLVIDNTAGTAVSANITISGGSPIVGPFININPLGVGIYTGSICTPVCGFTTGLQVFDASGYPGGNSVLLLFSTPTLGSLIGYNGGSLLPYNGAVGTFVAGYATQPYAQWNLTSGSLTPSVVTPEPSSVVLTLSGIGFVFLLVLKRKGLAQNHQQAT